LAQAGTIGSLQRPDKPMADTINIAPIWVMVWVDPDRIDLLMMARLWRVVCAS
jgi:hypothetical protein